MIRGFSVLVVNAEVGRNNFESFKVIQITRAHNLILDVSRSRSVDPSIVRRRHGRCHVSISDVDSPNTVLIIIRVSSVTGH